MKKNLWKDMLENNIVKYSTPNALIYYFKNIGPMDSILTNYLNGNSSTILFNYNDINEEFEEQGIQEFFADVIKNKELTNEKYEMILKGYMHIMEEFLHTGIEDDKFKILVKLGIIEITKENIGFIRIN
jgi:hypothetical protein